MFELRYLRQKLLEKPFKGIPEQFCKPGEHIRVGYDFDKKCFTGYIIEDDKEKTSLR
jgi:hypothetical protein